jgi:hypothetical protein
VLGRRVAHAAIGLVLLAGCGGDDSTDRQPRPKANVNHEPRVEGEWRIVYTPLGGEQEERATWDTRPVCDTGPCDFTITSDAGARYRFEYDPAVKDWTGRDRQVNDCVNEDGTVALKRAYVVRSQITLTPTRAVKKSNGTFITEMFGDRRDKNVLTDAGRDEGCPEAAPVQVSVRAVRADPPAGKSKPIGGVGYGE